jgi:hypothetical protein
MNDNTENRGIFYELISAAFGLALMGIFGILFLLPVEIQIVTITQSTFYAYICIGFAIMISYFVFTLYTEIQRIILRILEIISLGLASGMCIIFIVFTKNLTNSWLPQGAWFIHENGIIIGLFLGSVVLKTSGALISLFTTYHDIHTKPNAELQYQYAALLLFFTASFIGFGFWMYRFKSPLAFFVSVVILQSIFVLFGNRSILSKRNKDLSHLLITALNFAEDPYDDLGKKEGTQTKRFKEIIKRWFDSNNTILDNQTWKLIKQFRTIAIILILAGILHFFEVKYKAFVYLEYAQILIFLAYVFLFLHISTKGFKDSSNARYGHLISNGIASQGRYAIIDNINQLSHFGLIIVICFIQYFYRNPMYIPEVMAQNMIFTGMGVGIYYLIYYIGITKIRIKNIQYLSLFIVIFSSILLVLNILLIYYDGIKNGISFDGDMTLNLFPFEYLFSITNSLLVGFSTGLILSDYIQRFAFDGRDYIGAPSKALTIILTIFITGLLLTVFNYILVATPGGLYPFENPNLFRSLLVFLIILIIFIVMCYIFSEFVILRIFFKEKIQNQKSNSLKMKIKTPLSSNFSTHIFKKAKTILIGTIILVSLFSSVGISSSHAVFYQKPIIAISNGDYYIWVEDSSEIVTQTTQIALQASPKIQFATLNLAKNEYGAIQFVFNPMKNLIGNISYRISEFIHDSNSNELFDNSTSSLRWVRSVIDEQYPDVLIPFTTIQFNKSQNIVFWFSIRTPFHILDGNYFGNITLDIQMEHGNITEILPIQLKIWNFSIPETRHLRTRYWRANFETADIESFFSHRVNSDGVPLGRANNITDLESRLLMWQMWTCNLSGNLGWAAYTNRHGAYSIGYNGYSDGVQLYWEGKNYYESIRWENLLEGIEDYEYFWILNATLKFIEANKILPSNITAKYRVQLNAFVLEVAGRGWEFTHNVDELYDTRFFIGNLLHELSQYVNLTAISEQKINWQTLSFS